MALLEGHVRHVPGDVPLGAALEANLTRNSRQHAVHGLGSGCQGLDLGGLLADPQLPHNPGCRNEGGVRHDQEKFEKETGPGGVADPGDGGPAREGGNQGDRIRALGPGMDLERTGLDPRSFQLGHHQRRITFER